jgi:hypothetical protein
MLMSRCVTLASDLIEPMNGLLPAGSDLGAKAFEGLVGMCHLVVARHGELGYRCFETAFRRAFRSGHPSAFNAANAEMNLCIAAGSR